MRKGVLLILDGYGEGVKGKYNAVENANTPVLKKIKSGYVSHLKTHGEAVGLFENDMGGSEVGHLTIGAGRVVNSTAKQISDDIKYGVFKNNKVLSDVIDNLSENGGNLHLIGMMSDKNVHSNINHCLEIIRIAHDKVKNIFIHFICDGRDCGIHESLPNLKLLNECIKDKPNCQILSVAGRFYSMDRDGVIERTEQAFEAMFYPHKIVDRAEEYITSQHNDGIGDENIPPISVKSSAYKGVSKHDVLMFFNFREDRLRQIGIKCQELGCEIVTMSNVGGVNSKVMYPKEITHNTLSEYLSQNNLNQIKITETTKYAHLTYFLNGGREKPFEKEDRICLDTIQTSSYANTPRMRSEDITKEVQNSIKKGYDAVIINFPNPDMVGHMGDYDAVVEALEYLDICVGKILECAKENDYFVMLVADHGNAECMVRENGEPNMSHTLNKVFCAVVDNGENIKLNKEGELKNVAPTFVEMLGLKPSPYFDGKSLIV